MGYAAPQPPQADLARVRSAAGRGFKAVLLLLVGDFVPYAGIALAVAGFVLLLLALRDLSQELGEPRIYGYAKYILVVGVAGAAAFAALVVVSVFGAYALGVAGGYLYKRMYSMLSERAAPLSAGASEDFGRAARWYWIGALLAIVLVGVALTIVGQVYALLGFRELEGLSPPAAAQAAP